MLKILNTSEIREWDAFTINKEPIASIDLMERACVAFVHWFATHFDQRKSIGIVCGTGNNGGDGLGIARLLKEMGYPTKVWIVNGNGSEDFNINKQRLSEPPIEISSKPEIEIFNTCDILIDGIFGSGLSRAPEDIYAEVITAINNAKATVVAIDIPSGLFADKHTSGVSVHADYTVTFQTPKLAFLLPENEDRVGQWTVVDIGLNKTFLKESSSKYFWVERKWVKQHLPKRKEFAHKGDFGRALLIAGSFGKMGAAVLCARAAMKSGTGLLTVHIPNCGYQIIQTSVPEAMASVDENENVFTSLPNENDYTAIGIGPGLGQDPKTVKGLADFLKETVVPLVIDADGINILAANSNLLHLLKESCILTPHPGELQRLIGDWDDDFHRLEKAKAFASQMKCILVIKGAHTSIVSPDGRVFFNSSGNPGMATAGSGDVLTGIITSLRAQRMDALDAAVLGVYIHGYAGDLAVWETGQTGLMASDIVNSLPEAFKQLSG
ncbi:MAG TPA: NAD(P)H-hydrate dehydratase [Cyclobacteriaceae bacterium]|nr:NAD(P)H-hydrate dehydratase [Cyclobacteriaceae bacterium]HNP08198.1 NAD(P)H-hydrate dehydratase [Cyclobacteriaceae bacterium]HRK53041.1 NAD(P)H-hydrate dehydratase [Cyclobacteriaceae bacterium]